MDFISIHAPREGSDVYKDIQSPGLFISIHAPGGGSARLGAQARRLQARFLPTPPGRGATQGIGVALVVGLISIHAPREGSDRTTVKTTKPLYC